MRTQTFKSYCTLLIISLRFCFLALVFSLLSSCLFPLILIDAPRVNSTYDEVKKTSIHKVRFTSFRIFSLESELIRSVHQVIKSSKNTSEANYICYDHLEFEVHSYELEQNVYFILENSIISIPFNKVNYDITSSINEETEDVQLDNSTTSTVVTGYNLDERLVVDVSYNLIEEDIASILNSNTFSYRYYFGPEILTVKLNESELKLLKNLIEAGPVK